ALFEITAFKDDGWIVEHVGGDPIALDAEPVAGARGDEEGAGAAADIGDAVARQSCGQGGKNPAGGVSRMGPAVGVEIGRIERRRHEADSPRPQLTRADGLRTDRDRSAQELCASRSVAKAASPHATFWRR